MSRHGARVRWLICGGLAGLLAGALLQSDPRRPASVLDGVAGLDRPVTFSETKIPLGELVEKVAAATGAPLAAAPEVADEPVAVVVTGYPARELLRQTGALLDFQWRRRGSEAGTFTYEIGQGPAERYREEVLRNAAIADALRQFEMEVRRTVELAALSPEQLRSLPERAASPRSALRVARSTLNAEHATRDAERSEAEEQEWRERLRVARNLTSPVAHFLGRFLGTLSPAHWRVLIEEGRPLVFSSRPGPGELLLPAAMARELASRQPRMFAPGARLVAGGPDAEAHLRRQERELQEEWAAADGYRVILQTNARRLHQGNGRLRLTATAAPAAPGAHPDAARWGTSLTIESGPAAPRPPVGERGEAEEAGERDPVFAALDSLAAPAPELRAPRQGAVAFHAERGARSPERLPTRSAERGARSAFPRAARPQRFFDRLPLLARTYEIHLLSDAYDSAPRLPEYAGAGSEAATLQAMLRRWAGATHQWDRQGKLVRLRSRTWFFDRPREVPCRLLRRWQRLCDLHGALSLEEWATGVAGLKDGQLETLAEIAAEWGLPPELGTARVAIPALRLYASLSSEQQKALASGEAISAASMRPKQRELFFAAVQSGGEALPALLSAADRREASFSLSRASFVRLRERQGDAVRYRLEPAAATEPRESSTGVSMPLPPSGSPAAAAPGSSHARYPVTQETFHFRLPSGSMRSIPVITAVVGGR